jgi:hypothetical protein
VRSSQSMYWLRIPAALFLIKYTGRSDRPCLRAEATKQQSSRSVCRGADIASMSGP